MDRFPLLFAAAVILMATRVRAEGTVDKPLLSVGDRWTYKVADVQKGAEISTFEARVTAVADDRVEIQRTTLTGRLERGRSGRHGQSRHCDVDRSQSTNGRRQVRDDRVSDRCRQDLGYEFKTRAPNGFETSQQRTAKVQDWEEVRVTAGTFKALKIVHDGRWTRTETDRTDSGVVTDTIWYSPEVKRFVKREYQDRTTLGRTWDHSTVELVSFEVR